MSGKWHFWIDCGGTFTDIIAVDDQGMHHVHKVLSHSPHYKSAVVQGITELLGHTNFSLSIESVRLGTTVATNAFLEKKGIECALVTTLGQRDVLKIRQQNRPELFALDIKKIPALYSYVTHVQGRMNAQGEELEPLDLEIAEFELQRILDLGINSLAISLMHSTINPEHESRLGELANRMGFDYVALSHQVSPIAKYIARTETTVVDAYLSPYLRQYTQELEKDLGISNIFYMQSDGNLCRGFELKGYNALLSGPAGGLVGAINTAKSHGHDKIITFDMGGTSTDVAIYDGEIELDIEPEFHGIKLLAPMAKIHTVAAGGGSVLKYDQGRFLVGPESARAYPGPACYRNGGPLTVTDANLFLGKIDPDKFPKIFGKNQDEKLDIEIVKTKFEQLACQTGISAKEVAEGFIEVAIETMSRAIKKVSIEKGHDPKEFTLVSFGGAGGQLATKVAESLQISNVYIHPLSSVLSAYGIGQADYALTKRGPFSEGHEVLKKSIKSNLLEKDFEKYFILNAKGSDHEVQILAENLEKAVDKFKKYYKKTFGVEQHGEVECKTLALKVFEKSKNKKLNFLSDKVTDVKGPQVINENKTSIVLEKGWIGNKTECGEWSLSQQSRLKTIDYADKGIELEIYYQRFQFIAEQMGYTLQKLAQSVNIKERNDFSCALFSKEGELLSNAPHIPVHLGSMGDAVKAVLNNQNFNEGDCFICNDPSFGGTHLPDVTVIMPVFFKGSLVMWVASRGHHADIGGITPGSMPGSSSSLEEEGVIIPPTCFVRTGELNEELLETILKAGRYPCRNIALNIHDIKAKLAANYQGVSDLIKLFEVYGISKVFTMIESIMDYSDKKMQSLFSKFSNVTIEKEIAENRKLKVSIVVKENLTIDFTGSSKTLSTNFNAPVPVVKATVLFVLRTLIKDNIPLNDGILRHIDLILPKDSMINPKKGSPVVAGNVETSQAICDLLYEAFGIKANSQGTMNNLSFGNTEYQYYETLAGGSGATETSNGASAVQVNMTNSLLTDPEVFERRFPVILDLMAVRSGSGGKGYHYGGDGIYRKITFLNDMEVSMISQRRITPPAGLKGSSSALVGNQFLEHKQVFNKLPECFQINLVSGDTLYIETPGGGGFGKNDENRRNLVFGFGSNMDVEQIKHRCPSAKLITRGIVQDREIRYSRYSHTRRGGVADMYLAPGHKVWGLLVDIDDKDLAFLDQIECGDNGYKRIEVEVIDDNGKVWNAYAYDVIDKKPDIKPTKIYEWLVYSGAYNLNTPKKYLNHIRSFRGKNE